MFQGIIPAIITPFKRVPSMPVDVEGLRSNTEYLLSQGIHAIVPCGSTGESATLNFSEHELVIEEVVSAVGGSIPVIAGTGSNNTEEALTLTKAAARIGADAALAISPYYNKPNRAGLIKHYTLLAECGLPIIVYNVPSRTGQNLPADLIIELAKNPDIVGVKEASGDLGQISQIIEGTRNLDRDIPFCVLSGDDNLTLPILSLGGTGVISVAANLEPARMVELYEACRSGSFVKAQHLHYELSPLFRAMFIDTNPIPVKKAVELRGRSAGPLRLPLVELDEQKTVQLREVMSHYD
ncbi:MAG: 4-hydroxy-tetrahydrodipicolinate synthase [Methanocalculus sp.]|uniref:4-hydroxy-tetrahydrodipicolinate synthase n=1 Tax=Methanocalculus sp. TaxID=2004547 RepID=UPI002725BEAF|nr:4-hydroxy-tetrahydrodipicolinate synthase [Methanocalculus sp.]MDO8841541.1 4-hydroxy-tetrahydrodipicolinate synthase [Methanocalculus sp.]MDO9540393.1 4-hydroxy-tetrahydrodipicolinate synthase [Methanocalculus sp.]